MVSLPKVPVLVSTVLFMGGYIVLKTFGKMFHELGFDGRRSWFVVCHLVLVVVPQQWLENISFSFISIPLARNLYVLKYPSFHFRGCQVFFS